MTEYLYGIFEGYNGMVIEKTETIRQTKKQIVVKEGIDAYGYKTRISKDDKNIAFSQGVAIEKFVEEQSDKIKKAKKLISIAEQKINEAKRLQS